MQEEKVFNYPLKTPEQLLDQLKDVNIHYEKEKEEEVKKFLTHNSYFKIISDMKLYMEKDTTGKYTFPKTVQFWNLSAMYILSTYVRAILFRHIGYIENSFKNIFCLESCKTLGDIRWTERSNYNEEFIFDEIEKQKNLVEEMRKVLQEIDKNRETIELLTETIHQTKDWMLKKKLEKGISDIKKKIKQLSRKGEKNYFLYIYVKWGYTTPKFPPFWNVMENLTLGSIVKMYRCVIDEKKYIRGAVAKHYKVSNKILWSWMQAITNLRNICCHHNKLIGEISTIANDNYLRQEFQIQEKQRNHIYHLCCIMYHMLLCIGTDRARDFYDDLSTILSVSEDFVLNLAFPKNWQQIYTEYVTKFTDNQINLMKKK